ncbi:MAG TPA: prepilin-type N-terminal cleavage/methylation domain-containing protein [Sedimentisphaerales bacterium]|nr:prepilin-type N-terminal cleavage/methylation domain-containing protein [Sedimentisphaerales bacterium]
MRRKGFTLVELMITAATLVIVLLGIGVALVDSQKGYSRMYNRVHGEVATDSYTVKKVFDNTIRRASQKRYVLGTSSLAVFYYSSPTASQLDRYANFRAAGETLYLDYGAVDSSGKALNASSTMTAARHVKAITFDVDGACVKMVLTLDDGREKATVTCSAVRHND